MKFKNEIEAVDLVSKLPSSQTSDGFILFVQRAWISINTLHTALRLARNPISIGDTQDVVLMDVISEIGAIKNDIQYILSTFTAAVVEQYSIEKSMQRHPEFFKVKALTTLSFQSRYFVEQNKIQSDLEVACDLVRKNFK